MIKTLFLQFIKMTLSGVSEFTLSSFQNQWTDFDNFCINLKINQCYIYIEREREINKTRPPKQCPWLLFISYIYNMLQNSQNRRKYPCDSVLEAGSQIIACFFS